MSPMIAFIGVRISWLIDARNCDFVFDALERRVACRRELGRGLLALGDVARVHDEAADAVGRRAGWGRCLPSSSSGRLWWRIRKSRSTVSPGRS